MVERSQKEVWRLTPWLVILLLLANFVLMALTLARSAAASAYKGLGTNGRRFRTVAGHDAYNIAFELFRFHRQPSFRTDRETTTSKQKVQELQIEIKGKEELTAENERLKALLDLKEKSKISVLPARIIGRDPVDLVRFVDHQIRAAERT
jgi:cell shape-determining protein MreC